MVTLLLVLKSLERGSRWCFRTSKPRRQVLLPFLLLFIFVDSWKKHEYSLGKKRGPNYLAKLSTLVKNLRKSRIQHYGGSKLRFLLEWIKVDQKCQKWSILANFLKTRSLQSNSVTRQVTFNRAKIWWKMPILRHFG